MLTLYKHVYFLLLHNIKKIRVEINLHLYIITYIYINLKEHSFHSNANSIIHSNISHYCLFLFLIKWYQFQNIGFRVEYLVYVFRLCIIPIIDCICMILWFYVKLPKCAKFKLLDLVKYYLILQIMQIVIVYVFYYYFKKYNLYVLIFVKKVHPVIATCWNSFKKVG